MTWAFEGLRMFGYNLIYADPCWRFDTYSEAGAGKSPDAHYDTMTIDEIAALPVGELAQGDCALALWVVDPLLDEGIRVLKHWGFQYKTVLFTWTKEKPSGKEHLGPGYHTRANPEMCLLGMMGSVKRRDAGVRQWRHAAVREHSRKPDEFVTDLERLYGNIPRVELFTRTRRPGWDSWGKEVDKFTPNELLPAVPHIMPRASKVEDQPRPQGELRLPGICD